MGYLNNGIGAARINDSSPSDHTTYSSNKIETKQNSTDNTLTTTSKTIVGAINEVNSKVNNKFIVVQTLPVSDIDEFAIYLVPKSTSQTNNVYDEYIYISTDTPAHWEKIGDTEIDLSGYYTSNQVDTLLADKQDATDNSLQTVDKTIIGAINEQQSVIGYSYDAYDATTAYAKDDLCIYNNVLYKAKQATTGNLPTNTTYWEQTSIADEIGRIDTASKFRVGDTITASVYKHCAGRLTNAGDKVLFFYPLEKPVDSANVTDALLTFSANGLCYTANGGFGLVSGSYAGTITDGGIYFIIDLTQAQSSIGARPATVEFQARTITFR